MKKYQNKLGRYELLNIIYCVLEVLLYHMNIVVTLASQISMNIEDILPELFGEKRVYYCQRCLNHGLREKRKNHKQLCSYRNCQCSDCIMVDRRRELNSRLVQIDGFSESSSDSAVTNESVHSNRDVTSSKIKERRPNCQRCAQHGVVNRLKGHKRACPFKECFCPKCQVVVERQKLMADQIKLRRRQKREKNMRVEKVQTSTNNSNSIPFRFEYISQKEQLRLYAMAKCGWNGRNKPKESNQRTSTEDSSVQFMILEQT